MCPETPQRLLINGPRCQPGLQLPQIPIRLSISVTSWDKSNQWRPHSGSDIAWPKKACKQDLWGCPGLWHLGVGSGSFGSCGERHGASMDWAFSSRAQGCSGIWRPCRYPGLLVKFLGPLSSFCHCLVGWTTGCCCHEGVNLALFWLVYLLNRTQCFPAEHFNKMINVNSFTHHWF